MSKHKKFSIAILSDSTSWINPAVEVLVSHWKASGHNVLWSHDLHKVPDANFCFCLSFSQLVPLKIRQKFHHTLVVHESDLPAGKGWSPLTWQILDGASRIPVTLFEATDEVDSGTIYAKRWINFGGHELINELRDLQGRLTQELCCWFVDNYPNSLSEAVEQYGQESFYPRRRPEDSELDPNKTIAEQFNLLRVVDNERYPAWFEYLGKRFEIRVTKV